MVLPKMLVNQISSICALRVIMSNVFNASSASGKKNLTMSVLQHWSSQTLGYNKHCSQRGRKRNFISRNVAFAKKSLLSSGRKHMKK